MVMWYTVLLSVRPGITVSISGFHPGDPGSIPGVGIFIVLYYLSFSIKICNSFMIPTLYYKVYKMNMSDYSQLNNGDKVTVTLMNHDILMGTFLGFD